MQMFHNSELDHPSRTINQHETPQLTNLENAYHEDAKTDLLRHTALSLRDAVRESKLD